MQKSSAGGPGWILQRLSAIFLIYGMFAHFWLQHIANQGKVDLEFVRARLASSSWQVFDILLLLAVVYHAFNGIYNVIGDYKVSAKLRLGLSWLLILVGAVIIFYGTYAVLGMGGVQEVANVH
jgi:succinate dehydrogenase / fumarate reductase, membrane anchor subunit